MKNNHNLLMKMKNLEKFSGAIKRCVAIAMATMLFATTGFSLDTHPVKAQEVSSSADKIEIPEISKDAFKKYKKISGIGANTILGADFTYYQQCLEWGKSSVRRQYFRLCKKSGYQYHIFKSCCKSNRGKCISFFG